jgi:phosphatidate cytidylyltransferase
MSELARRVAFAVVAAPAAIYLIYLGGLPLALLLAVVAGLGAWELYRMARNAGIDALDAVGIPLAALVPLLVHAHYLRVYTLPFAVMAVVPIALLAIAIFARGVAGKPLASVAVTLFGVMYVGTLGFGYALRYFPYASGRHPTGFDAVDPAAGTAVVALPVLLTWASDTGAYFAGRAFGKRKLIPSVSPGKTVAGAVGGLLLSMIVCWAYTRWVLPPLASLSMSVVAALAFGAIISVAAQLGDLAESLVKRDVGVKDSSHIIPGHGGILDRFDSLFFVMPVAWLVLLHGRLLHVAGP